MSNTSKEYNGLLLKHATLKGFKSIENLSIDFNESLNIMIGKNASGKSNILEFLFQAMRINIAFKSFFKNADLEFIAFDNILIKWQSGKDISAKDISAKNVNGNDISFSSKESFEERLKVNEILIVDNIKVFDNTTNEIQKNIEYKGKKIPPRFTTTSVLRSLGYRYTEPLYIKYNLPDNLECVSIPGTIQIPLNDENRILWPELNTLNFLLDLFWQVEMHYNYNQLEKITKSSFLKNLEIDSNIKRNLKNYSPIQDIKFNKNINIYEDDKSMTIENLKIDFRLNKNWVPWSQLSDGTKRLFYLITEVTNKSSGLILLDEPELGIHPHQFDKVMEFLKEESENKQIIISTHSPQALNHLKEDELSQILIAYFDQNESTQLKHLSATQIRKAKKYMKEVGFLSDYWLMSDLES